MLTALYYLDVKEEEERATRRCFPEGGLFPTVAYRLFWGIIFRQQQQQGCAK